MFKWIMSTIFAGIVGTGAIGAVLYASIARDEKYSSAGLYDHLREIGEKAMKPLGPLNIKKGAKLTLAGGKSDRLIVSSKGLATTLIIHDNVTVRRKNRKYIEIRPYAKLTNALATSRPDDMSAIPPFDPFRLYANTRPLGPDGEKDADAVADDNVTASVSPLPLSIGKGAEKYAITDRQAMAFALAAADDYFAPAMEERGNVADADAAASPNDAENNDRTKRLANTTIIYRRASMADSEPEQLEQLSKTVRQGDNLNSILRNIGAEGWQASAMIAAMNRIYPAKSIRAGQILRYVAAPKPGDAGKTEPIEISLYEKNRHLVTVSRNEAGDYVASKKPGQAKYFARGKSYSRRASLYQSFYHSALLQKLPPAKIMKLLRIHAFDTDFKRRTQPGDSFGAFYDTRRGKSGHEIIPRELLFTSITVNGEKRAFYRFRTPDGKVDYYDRNGDSAKKFLMRKPVRSNRIRLASGFGMRFHPILKRRKMHTGTDWAGPIGTPILAAGNGVIEFAGRKGGYGNYIRIRHANGYKTAYAHMHHFAAGMKPGIRVRQGQVIGYLGNSGRSTGPHLHFEVLVNNKFVNAMTIPVPRGRELKGHLLAQFIKERDRIDELMSRDPVSTRIASARGNIPKLAVREKPKKTARP
jgi:murein DD-endopeptidase MepM/ murein hydrolase activator NlpD